MKNTFVQLSLLFIFSFFSTSLLMGQHLKNLPRYHKEDIRVAQDWLVDSIGKKTAVYQSGDGQIVLSNGLISRKFEVDKNGATIAIENMVTDQNHLRSIRPEAMVEIDGVQFPVGGLIGQPIHNYLLEDWVGQMERDPAAFRLDDVQITETEERFPWKKRPEWMPVDLPWPAPGKKLSFIYRGDQQLIDYMAMRSTIDEGRPTLFLDDFNELEPHWEVNVSAAYERNSFINEGKPGEIMAMSNQSVAAEMINPENANVWIVQLDPGTDKGTGWGIGMALISDRDNAYKINVRPGDESFGVYDGLKDQKIGEYDAGKSVFLRAEQKKDSLSFSYSYDGESYQNLRSVHYGNDRIKAIRIGKMAPNGSYNDHDNPGSLGRGKIIQVKILGELDEWGIKSIKDQWNHLKDVEVAVHYEMYDGIPLMSKWIEVLNKNGRAITVNSFKSEILALMEVESAVDNMQEWLKPNITVETDYRFGGMSRDNLYSSSIAWNPDLLYKTQVNYELKTPLLLEAYPKLGPEKKLDTGEVLTSFRTWELFHDSWDRERKGLAVRKMYRSQAPWVTENPIMMHVRNADDASVKKAIDQAAEVGFEMVIMTFGSGFQIENNSPDYLNRMEKLTEYAHSRGIALGGYSLLASRKISEEDDVVMPKGMRPRFGNSPCLESKWGINYFDKLYDYFRITGQDVLEHDGSYPGDVCASHDHPGHKGLEDSQWNQYETIRTFYEWCRSRGIFLNVPDHYFMAGSNKTGMGYRETNWSLPRAQQEIIERQNIYDGTWDKTPSMGWMFVPLVEYHGGGEAATIEPLKDHLPHYEQRLANLFGAGVQALYRGPQLYDSPQTKEIVAKWVDFYKDHREVLDGDIVHVRRADGRDYDGILHVNPHGKEKGLIMLYNPLDTPIEKLISINLYYTGLRDKAKLIDNQGDVLEIPLSRDYSIMLPVQIPPHSQQWFVVE